VFIPSNTLRSVPNELTRPVPGQEADVIHVWKYEGVSKSFRTGPLERKLQMVQLSTTRCSCIAILWVSLRSSAAITLCVASQQVVPKVSVYFIIDSVRKLLDTPSYTTLRSSRSVNLHATVKFNILYVVVITRFKVVVNLLSILVIHNAHYEYIWLQIKMTCENYEHSACIYIYIYTHTYTYMHKAYTHTKKFKTIHDFPQKVSVFQI
jgi:hypothetical protein